ncbi:MAG: rhomboid family intramembrane serine protease [Flavisolibacter sp.]
MPQFAQSINVPGKNTNQVLSLSYATFKQLGWTVELVVEDRLVGYSKKIWNNHADHIIVDAAEGELHITSKLPDSAAFDLLKKNQKNVAAFEQAFQLVKQQAGPDEEEKWDPEIQSLRAQTEVTLNKETEEAEKTDAVMNLSKGSQMVTYTIMGLNVLIFLAMVLTGVALFEPLVDDLARWGANVKSETLNGEWWRLITSVFVHIGLIHILFNMYALYMVGIYLEPMLGKGRYIAAYLGTGLLASVTSTWWHDENLVSAGASGAIFGLYGVFLALLTTKLIPKSVRKGLLQSIGIFIGYNILYGAKSDATDNAAHLGGLLSGFVIGYLYFFSIKQPARISRYAAIAIVVIASITITAIYLDRPVDHSTKYMQALESFEEIEIKALAPLNQDDTQIMLQEVIAISKPEWQKAKDLIDKTSAYNLNPKLSKNRQLVSEYIDLRIRQTDLIIKTLQGDPSANEELSTMVDKLNAKVDEITSNYKS